MGIRPSALARRGPKIVKYRVERVMAQFRRYLCMRTSGHLNGPSKKTLFAS